MKLIKVFNALAELFYPGIMAVILLSAALLCVLAVLQKGWVLKMITNMCYNMLFKPFHNNYSECWILEEDEDEEPP